MWAAPPAALPSFTPYYDNVKPPQRCLRSLATSRRPDNHDAESRESVGVMGQAVLTAAYKSKASSPAVVRVKPSTNKKQEQGEGRQEKTTEQEDSKMMEPPKRQLSGSQVLRALRRASVEKAKQLQQSKKKQKKRDTDRQEEIKDEVDTDDYHSVRPLCIKSEWDGRLVELEKRLEELSLMDV
ncbi:hypothetical protein ACH5RR_000021 [Cinchona calisaya]|uniref:Uncharacterized protein n=1 Tax=Cinchona calisaya TaxID=153742 RepID=A0ABD3AZI7_9GENT